MAAAPAVLVADDHKDSRSLLRAMLEYRGSRVLEAADGVTCVRIAREHRPDVIVLDLFMPGLDGWQVAETLHSDPTTSTIPILVFTASAMPDDHRKALEAGCRRVMVKPATPSSVADEVAALHAEYLALLEQTAAMRDEFLAMRDEVGLSLAEGEALRTAMETARRESAEQRARSEAAGAAASKILGGGDVPPADAINGDAKPRSAP